MNGDVNGNDAFDDDDLWDRALADAFRAEPEGDKIDDSRPDRIGRYAVRGEIARGGMGVVWRAKDDALGREIAIKRLRADHAGDPGMTERFLEEAQIGGQLRHPGLVPVHEIGLDGANRPFFTMELVEGKTFAALLAARQTPSDARATCLSVFAKVADTLAYAHSRGVLHRDLKPANVLVGAFGDVRVVDWGFAKVLGKEIPERARSPRHAAPIETVRSEENPSSHSITGSVLGTPAYMAPEQARGEIDTLDFRADVFALGAILTEILTGEPPFPRGDRVLALENAQKGNTAPALDRLDRADADPDLVELAKRCLAADRTSRPADAAEVADRVSRHLTIVEDRARAAEVLAAEARGRAAEERKARRLAVALSVAVLVFFCVVVVFAVKRREDERREKTDSDNRVRSLLSRAEAAITANEFESARGALDRAREIADGKKVDREVVRELETATTRLRAAVTETERRIAREKKKNEVREAVETVLADPAAEPEAAEAAYLLAFAALGIAVLTDPPEMSAAAIATFDPAMRDLLVAALDDWAARRRMGDLAAVGPGRPGPARSGPPDRPRPGEESRGGERPRDGDADGIIARILRLADPDPWRMELRSAAFRDDRETLRRLTAVVDFGGQSPRSLELLALSVQRTGDRTEALRILREASLAHPGDFWLHHHYAAQLAGGPRPDPADRTPERLEAAIAEAKIAVALAPTASLARDHLASLYLAAGEAVDAVSVLRAGMRAAPADKRIRESLVRTLLATGDVNGAREAATVDGVLDSALMRRAVEIVTGSIDLAARESTLRTWLSVDADLPGVRIALARVFMYLGRHEEALASLRGRREEAEPSIVGALTAAASIALGRYDDAIAAVEGAATTQNARGVLGEARRLKDAAASLDRGEAVGEDSLDRLLRARVLLHRGKIVEAAALVSGVLKSDPDTFTRRSRLAPGGLESREGGLLFGAAVRDFVAALVLAGSAADAGSDLERSTRRRRDALGVARLVTRPPRGPIGRPAIDDPEAWLADPRLAAVRDAAALAGLAEDEAGRWREFWARFERPRR